MDRSRRAALALTALVFACGDGPARISGPDDPLLRAETCEECHPQHYREWLGSMHAYAAEDPVFLAMNARGQRETNGELGDFCIQCHAPVAVALDLTEDGLNIADVPQHLRGVTCYFCHSIESVQGTEAHNNPLELSFDGVMRGAINDPVGNVVHESKYSVLHDELTLESADLCGTCHDVFVNNVHLERTYAEWLDSFMADKDPLSSRPAVYGQRCGTCHMGPTVKGPVAETDNVRGDRFFHPHSMVGVDVALDDWPSAELGPMLRAEQAQAVDLQRKSSLCSTVCVNPDGQGGTNVDVWLHNEFTAHGWPSGATQDRRAWLELHVFAAGSEVFATGVVPDDVAVDEIAPTDPAIWLFREQMFDAAGDEVHMFWEVRSVQGDQLPAATVLSAETDRNAWKVRRFPIPGAVVDRVTSEVRLRPMDFSILDDLIESGDLDPVIRDAMQTFSVGPTVLEWTPAAEVFTDYGSCVQSSPSCGAPAVGAPLP